MERGPSRARHRNKAQKQKLKEEEARPIYDVVFVCVYFCLHVPIQISRLTIETRTGMISIFSTSDYSQFYKMLFVLLFSLE